MVAIKKDPNRRVYRYRQINEKTIDMLILDEVYFAHPSSFNDPLDCKPTIEIDSTNDNLKEILKQSPKRN